MENDQHESRLRAGFVALLFAARNLVNRLRFCEAGARPMYCSVCLAEAGDEWPGGAHERGCPVGQVATVAGEILKIISVEELGCALEDSAGTVVEQASAFAGQVPNQVEPWAVNRGPGEAAAAPEGWEVLAGPGKSGARPGGDSGRPGRKPPARVGIDRDSKAIAVAPGAAATDFGEPWDIWTTSAGDDIGRDRAGGLACLYPEEFRSEFGDSETFARRVVAAVNLCAGAPTEALEFAFQEISASAPAWALLALNIQNLTRAHVALIRDYIDRVVKAAADPAAKRDFQVRVQ